MSNVKDGGSAFPLPVAISPMGDEHVAYPGMSLRDYFAAKAMQGDCVRNEWGKNDLEDLASWAYLVADAMLKAREVQS